MRSPVIERIRYQRHRLIARAIPVGFRIEIGRCAFGLAWRRDWQREQRDAQ